MPAPRLNPLDLYDIQSMLSDEERMVRDTVARFTDEKVLPQRGKGKTPKAAQDARSPAERHVAMHWAQRLKRVFHIDIATCPACGGAVRVIASIEDPVVIKRILDHLDQQAKPPAMAALPEPRAPPAYR